MIASSEGLASICQISRAVLAGRLTALRRGLQERDVAVGRQRRDEDRNERR